MVTASEEDAECSLDSIINQGEPSNILKSMNLLLGSQLKVTMIDGRIVTGQFVSLDRLGNIVLENVIENRKVAYNIPTSNDDGITREKSKKEDCDDKEDTAQQQTNRQIQQTSTDSSIIQWDTQRSLIQAVILGSKLQKVEIEKREWNKCMIRE